MNQDTQIYVCISFSVIKLLLTSYFSLGVVPFMSKKMGNDNLGVDWVYEWNECTVLEVYRL